MNRAARGALIGTAIAPVTIGAVTATALWASGDERLLAIDLALPGSLLLGGALLSAVPACALIVAGRRRRSAERTEEAAALAASAARDAERTTHRRFLARLDHELKNPITAIRATAVTALEDTEDARWATVDRQATKLSTLVRDLRKLAELESRPLDREPVDLEALLRESLDVLTETDPALRNRLTLAVTRVPWPVPALMVDRDLLALAIDNVLGNAAKYAQTGPIEVRLREQDGWAVVEVADAGRGVPPSDLPVVFEELGRAQNARDVTGSGIGLTLVATIMRKHEGDVMLRSVEGSGTVVTLRLPVRHR